jgi:hypothetical protein
MVILKGWPMGHPFLTYRKANGCRNPFRERIIMGALNWLPEGYHKGFP